MKLAYLLNTYPMTSTTFIRREIEAVERAGLKVTRFAVRRWPERLADPDDTRELDKTHYIMGRSAFFLVRAFLLVAMRQPRGLASAAAATLGLSRAARGNRLRPFAYLVQAAYLFLQARNAGITHIHAHFSTNAAAVAMLCRLLGGPTYSFTVHGPDELMDPASLNLNLKVRHARSVVAITAYCRDRILENIEKNLASRVFIVPCGLNFSVFPSQPPAPAPTQELVCVGRLCPQKGQTHIPGAVALLQERFPGLRVRLIGDGESRGEIERAIARHRVGDKVQLVGWGSNQQVRDAITQAKALLLPSFHEGLPIVIMEAFALYRPVITTRIAGIPELVDSSCGWLVEPGNEQELADAMADAISLHPAQLDRMGAEGRRRVESRHDIDAIAPALLRNLGWTGFRRVSTSGGPADERGPAKLGPPLAQRSTALR
jgi:colanic acid/amylovoran biosynthesis glycosyltransferase